MSVDTFVEGRKVLTGDEYSVAAALFGVVRQKKASRANKLSKIVSFNRRSFLMSSQELFNSSNVVVGPR